MEKRLRKFDYKIIRKDLFLKKKRSLFRLRIKQDGRIKLFRLFGKKWLPHNNGKYIHFYPEYKKWAIIKNNQDGYDEEVLKIINYALRAT